MARQFMIEKDEVCGTCKWHRFNKIDGEWECINHDSLYCGEEMDYKDKCDRWEDKK